MYADPIAWLGLDQNDAADLHFRDTINTTLYEFSTIINIDKPAISYLDTGR